MSPTIAYIMFTLVILGASIIPIGSGAPRYQPQSLWKMIHGYLIRCATWAFIVLLVGGTLWLVAHYHAADTQSAMRAVKTGVVILIPTGIAAGAMWHIGRLPTLDELQQRELRKEQ